MKLSDYVTDFLIKKNIKHVFGITGGAMVHMFDSIGKNPNIKYICTHHEQAAAMAADGYSRTTKNIGVCMATSGPGATNLLTGVGCSYFDSIPLVIMTGQVPRSQLKGDSKVRQIGFQETDIISIFKPITKYAVLITDPEQIRYELEKAFYLAKNGRPGPVLLDIPDDVQRAEIEPEKLKPFTPEYELKNLVEMEDKIDKTIKLIEKAERPIVILGAGVKLGGTERQAKEFIEKLGFPVALTWAAIDVLPQDHALSVRDFGVTANRPGNFAIQNSDLILALGTRLDTHETGNDISTFAREAKRIVVDIDKSELEKYEKRNFPIDVLINSDVREFFEAINRRLYDLRTKDISEWIKKINEWKEKYPICPKRYFESMEQINPYVFLHVLSEKLGSKDIIIPEAGCNVTWAFQGFEIKEGQKLFTAFNYSPMGYGVPASIGACFANDKKSIIAIVGDGGIMMNEHELATIAKHNLPIKIFLMNNQGYGMIQQTQETWLDSRYEASTNEHFYLPDFIQLAKAHGIEKTEVIRTHEELEEKIKSVLDYNGPVLCDVRIHPKARIYPKLSFGRPIEDSEPLLSREEFEKEMIVKPIYEEVKIEEKRKEKIILDSHKIEWHPDRVNAWLRGERVAPITIDCSLTRRCNYNCVYCYGQLQANDEQKMTWEVIKRFLDDCAEIGVKAISFVSDGESTCSPWLYDAIVYGKSKGLDMALGTNGALLKKERLREILPCLTYLRFNISAGEPKRYSEIMGCREEDFYQVCENIKECVRLKKENNWDVTIGTQMVLMPEFKDQIIPLTKLGKELGVDYLVIKHCSDDESGKLGVPYDKYFEQDLIEKIKEAEAMSTEDYQVSAKWSKILSHGKRKYSRCHGPPFMLQLSGSGLVAPCGSFFNEKYKRFHIGNIAEKSFKEIWQSDRYWEVMNLITSDEFDAKTDCASLCLQHKVNDFLWDLKKRADAGEDVELRVPEGKPPMHVNFI